MAEGLPVPALFTLKLSAKGTSTALLHVEGQRGVYGTDSKRRYFSEVFLQVFDNNSLFKPEGKSGLLPDGRGNSPLLRATCHPEEIPDFWDFSPTPRDRLSPFQGDSALRAHWKGGKDDIRHADWQMQSLTINQSACPNKNPSHGRPRRDVGEQESSSSRSTTTNKENQGATSSHHAIGIDQFLQVPIILGGPSNQYLDGTTSCKHPQSSKVHRHNHEH
ncbi:hypothetical protein WH47_05902 [Habropoda laboriosa]|uniref:Uncharacterized protein n=1 Tax=Habropoda laboriosa TaxID=597456 RepID=A0A0L7REH8_9HYME|nr:hypothetical protein WH47_05902 [Habropoda laboriosa]